MSSENYSDTLLLNALRDDDEKALAFLFQTHYNRLFRMAIKTFPDTHFAKECIQQVFNELWTYRKSITEISSFEAYLKASMKRRIFKELNNKQKQQLREGHHQMGQTLEVPSWEEIFIEQQSYQYERQKLVQLLEQLSPRQKELIVLKYFDELSFAEIAERTGLQIDTIYKKLHEAIKRLKTLA